MLAPGMGAKKRARPKSASPLDYEIIQPFAQLGRPLFQPLEEERQETKSARFATSRFESGVLRATRTICARNTRARSTAKPCAISPTSWLPRIERALFVDGFPTLRPSTCVLTDSI